MHSEVLQILKNDIAKLRKQVANLEKKIVALEAAVKIATQEETRLLEIITHKNDRIDALEAEVTGNHEKVASCHAKIKHLQERLHNAHINGE